MDNGMRQEFEKQAEEFYAENFGQAWDSNKSLVVGALAEFGRAATARAYERAAQVAEREVKIWDDAEQGEPLARKITGQVIAEQIRALAAQPENANKGENHE